MSTSEVPKAPLRILASTGIDERLEQRNEFLKMSRDAVEFGIENGTVVWIGDPHECDLCEHRAEFEVTVVVKEGVKAYPELDTHYYCPLHNIEEMFSISVGNEGYKRRFSDAESFTVRVLCYVNR